MNFIGYFKKLDWVLIFCAVGVTVFGLMAIYSYGIAQHSFSDFYKQLVFFAVGFSVMLLVGSFDYRVLRNNSYFILVLYFICLALLIGLHFFAPNIRGTRGWYRIGFLSFDPLEPAKIVLIILLAKYFSMRHIEMYKFRHIFISGAYVFLMAVAVFIKPDLGGTMVLLLIWLGILLISGIKVKHFLILLLCFILTAGLSWSFLLKDYQKGRVISFIFPTDILGGSWSQAQTKVAIGSGQIFGQGIGGDSQVQYGFLPEPHTDFIFSAIGQEWGFLGITVLFLLYLLLVWRVLGIALLAETNFPRLFAVGFAIVLVSQFVINVGMNLSFLPVVGLYFPFASYGGSGLIGNFISIGILQSIKARRI